MATIQLGDHSPLIISLSPDVPVCGTGTAAVTHTPATSRHVFMYFSDTFIHVFFSGPGQAPVPLQGGCDVITRPEDAENNAASQCVPPPPGGETEGETHQSLLSNQGTLIGPDTSGDHHGDVMAARCTDGPRLTDRRRAVRTCTPYLCLSTVAAWTCPRRYDRGRGGSREVRETAAGERRGGSAGRTGPRLHGAAHRTRSERARRIHHPDVGQLNHHIN